MSPGLPLWLTPRALFQGRGLSCQPSRWVGAAVQGGEQPTPMTTGQWLFQLSRHCCGHLSRDPACHVGAPRSRPCGPGARLGNDTAPAVVGSVAATPHRRQASVGQSCLALPTAIGGAGLLPGLLALDGGRPLGTLGPWGLLGRLQGAGPHGQRLRLQRGWSRVQLLPQLGPQVSPRDADMGIRVLDEHLRGVHGLP